MHFTKMQGAGNDFVVVDARGLERDWSAFGMRTWDTDGSEAETCGNGIRCVARYVLEKGFADRGRSEITIETLAGVNHITFEHDENGRISGFVVNMARPRFAEAEIPFSRVDESDIVKTLAPN